MWYNKISSAGQAAGWMVFDRGGEILLENIM